MIIKNIGSKLVHVGKTALLPGDTMKANKDTCELPSIQALVRAGYLQTEETEAAPKAEKPKKAPKPKKEVAEEPVADSTEKPATDSTEE